MAAVQSIVPGSDFIKTDVSAHVHIHDSEKGATEVLVAERTV